jgi:hypothetical protein
MFAEAKNYKRPSRDKLRLVGLVEVFRDVGSLTSDSRRVIEQLKAGNARAIAFHVNVVEVREV